MGQAISTPQAAKSFSEFTNLPKEAIESLWTSYNLLGECWGLSKEEVIEIFQNSSYLENFPHLISKEVVGQVFDIFDTDRNGLIDAIELLVAIALVSCMDTVDKLYFVFNAYDFNSSNSLCYDELSLLLRSSVKGLQKACPDYEVFNSTTGIEVDAYAELIFAAKGQNLTDKTKKERVSMSSFAQYCTSHLVIGSWLRSLASFPPKNIPITQSYVAPINFTYSGPAKYVPVTKALVPYEAAVALSFEDHAAIAASLENTNTDNTSEVKANTPSEETKQSTDDNKKPLKRWMRKVDLLKPEELPFPRRDDPDEVFEPLWIFGCNINLRTAQYLQEVAVSAAPAEESEGAPAANSFSPIVFSAGSHVIVMKKGSDESGLGWTQDIYSAHSHPISVLQVSADKKLIVTAEKGSSATGATCSIVLWEVQADNTLVQNGRISILSEQGVYLLDISQNNALLLTVQANVVRTLQLFDLQDKGRYQMLFTLPLFGVGGQRVQEVFDVRFSNSSSLFSVAGSFGVRFFSDEGTSFLGDSGMRSYEERVAIFSVFGEKASSDEATALSRFEGLDEVVLGTNSGHVLLWRGRICVQMIESAHKVRVCSLDYNPITATLISAAEDGTVNVFSYKAESGKGGGTYNFAMRRISPPLRKLEIAATFDILRHDLTAHRISSVTLPNETAKTALSAPVSTRALLSTTGGEILEVSLKVELPSVASLVEAGTESGEPGEGGEDGAVPEVKIRLGDDVNGAPIIQAHAHRDIDSVSGVGINGVVTSVCRLANGANGFITAGGDSTVRLWQTPSADGGPGAGFKMIKYLKTSGPCGYIDASATTVAVTLTGSVSVAGKVQLYTLPDLQFVTELETSTPSTESAQPPAVTELRFSPDGSLLACGNRDGFVYLFALQQEGGGWVLKGKIELNLTLATMDEGEGRLPQPRYIDFSSDGLYLRVGCLYSDEFFIFDVAGPGVFGKDLTYLVDRTINWDNPPPLLDTLRNLTWASNSCPYNWDTKGLKALLSDVDLAAVTFDRSNAIVVSSWPDGTFGVDRLPALGNGTPVNSAPLLKYTAHSGSTSGLCFIEEGGAKLVTVGRHDGLVRVWKVTYDTDEYEPDPEELAAAGGDEVEEVPAEEEEEEEEGEGKVKLAPIYDSAEEEDYFDGVKLKEHLSANLTVSALSTAAPSGLEEGKSDTVSDQADSEFNYKAELEGPFSASATWTCGLNLTVKDALSIATRSLTKAAEDSAYNPNPVLPGESLVIDFVYGCSTRSTRGAVRYARDGRIVYPAGTIGVVFDKATRTQSFHLSHTDEITALDVHIGQDLAVTGTKGLGPITCVVWSTKDYQVRSVLPCGDGKEIHGVSAVAFSDDGNYVAAALQDSLHSILVFAVSSGSLIAKTRGGPRKVLNLVFGKEKVIPLSNGEGSPPLPIAFAGYRILQTGLNHFKTLLFEPHKSSLTSKTGGYGAGVKKNHALCSASLTLAVSEGDAGERVVSGNEFVIGLADGTIGFIARGESKVNNFSPALKGPVTAICVTYPNLPKPAAAGAEEEASFPYRIVCGGTNGQLKIFDPEGQPLSEFNLYKTDYGLYDLGRARGFKSIFLDKLNRKILYATAAGEVGEIELETGRDVNCTVTKEPDLKAPNPPLAGSDAPPQPPIVETVISKPLITSHFRDQLHGLCPHPFRQECITAGDDKTLRVWDLQKRTQLAIIELPDIVRSATYSPNGHIIILGLGGKVSGDKRANPRPFNGRVLVVSYLQGVLRIVHTANNALDTVTSVLFSPDGSKVYAASLDFNIYVYDALNNFVLLTTMTGSHFEGINCLDISSDGKYLLSLSVSRQEVVLWDLMKNVVVPEQDRVAVLEKVGLNWRSGQSPVGLHTLGIFPPRSQITDVLSVSQSNSRRLLASADVFGRIKLFNNPAINMRSQGPDAEIFTPFKSYFGHSPGGVSNVFFSPEDTFLLSVGRYDRSLIQWKVEKTNLAPDQAAPTQLTASSTIDVTEAAGSDSFEASFSINGVDFSRKFIRAITPASPLTKPVGQVHLASVLGVGNFFPQTSEFGFGSLPSAEFCGQGDIVSSSGRMPLLSQPDGKIRQWLTELETANISEHISAIATSSCGRYVLIGQNASSSTLTSRLIVLSAPSGSLISVLCEKVPGGVTRVAFSIDNLSCACISGSAATYHSLSLYRSFSGRWSDAQQVGTVAQVSPLYVSQLTFLSSSNLGGKNVNPTSAASAGYSLVTAGEGQMKWWIVRGPNLVSIAADQPPSSSKSPLSVTALTSLYGDAIAGDSEGKIYIWTISAGRGFLPIGSHSGRVSALRSFSNGFISASSDSLIIWQIDPSNLNEGGANALAASITLLKQFALPVLLSQIGPTFGKIHIVKKPQTYQAGSSPSGEQFVTGISCDPLAKRLVISTSASVRMLLSTDSGRCESLGEGHGGRVLGLLAHQTDPSTVFTICADGVLRAWDVSRYNLDLAKDELNRNSLLQGLICGALKLDHVPTAMIFLSSNKLLVAVKGADADGSSAAILEISVESRFDSTIGQEKTLTRLSYLEEFKYNLVIANRIHNVGSGEITSLALNHDASSIAACSQDGKVYLFRAVNYASVGYLTVNSDGSSVSGADFSLDSRYVRTFGLRNSVTGKIEVSIFDLFGGSSSGDSAGARLTHSVDLENVRESQTDGWVSCASSAAPEVKALSYKLDTNNFKDGKIQSERRKEKVCNINIARKEGGNSLVCAGYDDGSIQVFRYPAYSVSIDTFRSSFHARGPVLAVFTAGRPDEKSKIIVTVGTVDGVLAVWKLEA